MALQIWLPLNENGNLKNQGLANVTVGNNGATYNSSGKIGGCYSFNANTLAISDQAIGDNFSVSYWVKYNSLSYPKTQMGIQHSDRAYTSTNKGWDIGHGSSDADTYNFDINDGGNIQRIKFSFSNMTQLNVWKHFTLACSLSNRVVNLYVDGILVGTQQIDNNIGSFTSNRATYIGSLYGWSLDGYLNDIRIYDHCLSAQEVKEISKGLVLHYPLNQEVTKNLVPFNLSADNYTFSDYSNRTLSSIVDGIYHVDGYQQNSSIDTSFTAYSKQYITLNADTDYYLSFYCKSKSASELYFGTSGYAYTGLISNSNVRAYPVTSVSLGTNYIGWVSLKIHTGTDTQYKICLGFDTPNIYGIDSFIEFSNVMLSVAKPNDFVPYESNDIVYDSSGYNNNGTITGTLTTSTDTPRYDKCTLGTSSTITTPYNIPDGPMTLAFWQKPVTYTTEDTSKINIRFGNCQYFTYRNYSYFTHNDDYKYRYVNPFLDGNWHFIVCQFDGTNNKIFIDGSEITCNSSSSSLPFVNSLTMTLTNNNVSDFRIYATALSEDDIKDLYQEAAFIDHKGNIGCYQFYEDSENSKELWPTPTTDYTVTYNDDGSYTITGYKSAYSNLIPIDSSKTFYYDVEYSNLNAGNYFLIGFERYNIDRQTVINQGCQYVTTTKNAELHTRKVGTITFPAINENPAAFTRLRILNHWSGSTSDSPNDSEAIIHYISLKEVSAPTQNQINKQGQIKSDLFIEAESATVSKYGNITANQLIEI